MARAVDPLGLWSAKNHDTSVVMIERNYSALISDHSDAVARTALLDTAEPFGRNVVPIRP